MRNHSPYYAPRTPERAAWRSMLSRCSHPTLPCWPRYGGRGIAVWAGWRDEPGGFDRFIAHVGPRPSSRHTLDRIDNDGDYEPGNVRWATRGVQARNKRGSKSGGAPSRRPWPAEPPRPPLW